MWFTKFTKFWGEVKNGPSLGISKNKKAFSFRGRSPTDPPTRGSAPGPRWELRPQTPERSPSSKFATTPLAMYRYTVVYRCVKVVIELQCKGTWKNWQNRARSICCVDYGMSEEVSTLRSATESIAAKLTASTDNRRRAKYQRYIQPNSRATVRSHLGKNQLQFISSRLRGCLIRRKTRKCQRCFVIASTGISPLSARR